MKKIFGLSLFFPIAAWSAPAKDFCNRSQSTVVQATYQLPESISASYFARPFKAQRKIAFVGLDKREVKNGYVYDLNTRSLVKVPGRTDPETALADQILTAPLEGRAMGIFLTSKVMGRPNAKPIFVDENNPGDYQTTASIPNAPESGNERFIMLSEKGGLHLHTYSFDRKKEEVIPEKKVRLCGGRRLVFPMMSPSGREFSAVDNVKMESVVMEFDPTSGECKEKLRFPYVVGKMSFSPDGSKLAFHVDALSSDYGYYRGVSIEWGQRRHLKQAYVYDRNTGQLSLIDNQLGVDAYYPTFLNNEEIAYFTVDGRGKRTLKLAKYSAPTANARCELAVPDQGPALLLGTMFQILCQPVQSENDLNPSGLVATALTLESGSCRTLVHEHWNKLKALALARARSALDNTSGAKPIAGLPDVTEADLLAACP